MPHGALACEDGPLQGVLICPDGYLRLTLARLRAIPLVHLISGLDTDLGQPTSVGASASCIAGFTEWGSETRPALSLGWDWQLDSGDGCLRYVRTGEARSNIMLIDDRQRDRGWQPTATLLASAIDELDWQETVFDCVQARYRWPTCQI